jgi:hypothetical protein
MVNAGLWIWINGNPDPAFERNQDPDLQATTRMRIQPSKKDI